MKRIRHTVEQIIRKLKTAEKLIAQGKTVADIWRAFEFTQPTYHRWKQQYGCMKTARRQLRRRVALITGNPCSSCFLPVALALDADDVAVVHQPVHPMPNYAI